MMNGFENSIEDSGKSHGALLYANMKIYVFLFVEKYFIIEFGDVLNEAFVNSLELRSKLCVMPVGRLSWLNLI